jgi:hypothetical protein
MVKKKTTYKLSFGNPERRRPFGGLRPKRSTILKQILSKQTVGCELV